jgi:cleavage and polyadenylation specificity factor subunit 1
LYFAATLDGGIGYLLPLPEKVYRRLLMLQTRMSNGLPHVAGLNPKAFRQFRSRFQYLYTAQRNILDGELLTCYPQLSRKQRTDFAKQIGTSPAQILDDLKELDKITTHF